MTIKPQGYAHDAGVRLTFDTLTDRGFDDEVVAAALDAYPGDLWSDVFGPAIDRVASIIGISQSGFPEDDPATFYAGKTFDRQQHRFDQ
jgi:hypothetical protein